MKLITSTQTLTTISGGSFGYWVSTWTFSAAGAGIGAKMLGSMVPPRYKAFGVLVGGSIGGVIGYTIAGAVYGFEDMAKSKADAWFKPK